MTPLIEPRDIAALREALERSFSSAAVTEVLGLAGEAALGRGDLLAAGRALTERSETGTWVRLFLLGDAVSFEEVTRALRPWTPQQAITAGLLRRDGDLVRARLDVRPYAEAGQPDWWVLSDVGAELRHGPLDAEHVLGVGAAATTLAQAVMRRPVGSALDVGTGCGVQALHLSRHAERIVATDISARALSMAATTAALNGIELELRRGSFLDPVVDERFDLVVANPPFIVGPGFTAESGGFTYRDSGMSGDGVSRLLIEGLPRLLTQAGTAQLLANWAITADEPWEERLAGWLGGSECDAWIWQREVADPAEYVALWLRDSGEQPGSVRYRQRHTAWLDWFADQGVLAVGMGLVNLRRTGGPASVVCEDVPQAVEQPVGPEISAWFARREWLAARDLTQLLSAAVVAPPDLVLETRSLLQDEGWRPALSQLRQSHGLRWELEVDAAMAGLVASARPGIPLGDLILLLARANDLDPSALASVAEPMLRDFIQRGLLLPADETRGATR